MGRQVAASEAGGGLQEREVAVCQGSWQLFGPGSLKQADSTHLDGYEGSF